MSKIGKRELNYMAKLNQGLIYTNDKCIGCNRCIYACPVLGANVSKIENGKNRIYVDGSKCIHCGKCMEMCRHEAREYRDDVSRFLDELKNGRSDHRKISLLVDSTFYNNYPQEAVAIIGYLKAQGAVNVYDLSIGADIVTWAYIKFLNEHPMEGAISNQCPATVNYIMKYKPELLRKLVPIHTPMMATAIYAQKYLNDENIFAYIGPCIAKKDEIKEVAGDIKNAEHKTENNSELNCTIDYHITIEKLLAALENTDYMQYEEKYQTNAGLGVLYPLAGGLSENIKHFQGHDAMIRQVSGKDNAFNYLDKYSSRIDSRGQLPFLVDILNCNQGCICGTGVSMNGEVDNEEDIMYRIHEKRKNALQIFDDGSSPYSRVISREDRKMRLYKKYEALDLNDFLRDYSNAASEHKVVREDEIEYDENAIFNSMYKYTEEDRCIDCHSCGYDSCREMVKAIAYGYNFKNNCVHYVKDENLRLYMTDTLSGIPNTNAFMKRCSEIIQDGNAADYFAIYFNIKNMKLYNRKYGSKTGDIILCDYAKAVNSLADCDEIVGRWGGDNFVALFKKKRMAEVIERLENITINVIREGGNDQCHISFRAAIYELTGEEKIAGQVMGQITTTYSTVKQSKSNIVFFTEQLGKTILHNTMVEEMLEPALRDEEFVVYYQPKVCMENNNLVGAEALVRWIHDGKIIPPMEFIPICESNGFVQKIDFYVLEKVCQDIRGWLDQGIEMVKISFNFSKQHFIERHVADKINEIAEKYQIPREFLEVEFTETAYIDEFDNLVETIDELHNYEIYSSIDDFGTGYSSLSLLQNVKFNTLKLDKSFLNKYANNKRNRAVVANIIQMAKELDMDIVAEGIETSEEFKYLKMLSCDVAQGYLFDRPLPKEKFEERLKNKHYADDLIITNFV